MILKTDAELDYAGLAQDEKLNRATACQWMNHREKVERRKMTVIDFTAEVGKRKEELLADLFSLLKSTQNVMTARRTLSIHQLVQ